MTSHRLLKTATGVLALSLLAATLAPAASVARGTTGGASGGDGASGGTSASGGGRGTDGGSSSSGGASGSGGTGGGGGGRGNGDGERFPPRFVPPRIIVLDQRLRSDCVSRRVTDDWGYAVLRRACFRARFDGWN